MQWNPAYKLAQKIYNQRKHCACANIFFYSPLRHPIFYRSLWKYNTAYQTPSALQKCRHRWKPVNSTTEWTGSHVATPLVLQRWQALSAFENLLCSHSSEETHYIPLGVTIRFYSGKLIYFICIHWQKCQKLLSEDCSSWWLCTCNLLKVRPA